MLLLLNEMSPSGMGHRGRNVVGPIRRAALAFGVEKKENVRWRIWLRVYAWTGSMANQQEEIRFTSCTNLRSDFLFSALWGEGKFGTC